MDTEPPPTPPTDIIQDEAIRPDYTMGMLCHLLSLSALIGIPFGNLVGPLVVWLIKRDADPFCEKCGKESLNFQISITIYGLALGLIALPMALIPFLNFFLIPIIALTGITIAIGALVYVIIASIRASEGEFFEYPLTIRFIK